MKPKLAPGSRWEGNAIVDAESDTIEVWSFSGNPEKFLRLTGSGRSYYERVADASAMIRAAGLDPVWDAAVALRKSWRGFDGTDIDLATRSAKLIERLCAAVEAASEEDKSDD